MFMYNVAIVRSSSGMQLPVKVSACVPIHMYKRNHVGQQAGRASRVQSVPCKNKEIETKSERKRR